MRSTMKMMVSAVLAFASLAPVLGCSAAPGDPGAERVHRSTAALAVAIPANADLTVPTVGRLTFTVVAAPESPADLVWEERVDAPVFGGAQVDITATRERFPACGVGGEVTAFVRTNAGETLEVALDQGDAAWGKTGSFTMPAGVSSAEVWLRSSTTDGCVEWDSDFERNYPIDVYDWTPAVLSFDAQWNETETALPAGGAAVVDYDFARLPDCRTSYRGYPSWDILVHARFDDGSTLRQSMVQLGYTAQGVPDGTVQANRVVIPLPRASRLVELWFENTQYPPTCQAWDSDFGKNFPYAIVSGGALPGPQGQVSCAGGALVIRSEGEAGGNPDDATYTGVVTDQAAIDYFLARSQETHEQSYEVYGGGTATTTVQSYLPYNMVLEGDGAGRRLLVTELRMSQAGGFTAGQYLANFDASDAGLTLYATNLTMPGSHTALTWELGRWPFAGCQGR